MRCLLLRSLFLLAALASAAIAYSGDRHPMAAKAEAAFFSTFNGFQGDEQAKSAPLLPLLAALASDPADARTHLLLGLNHLWIAAEGDRNDPRALEHLFLAERYLARAQELNPKDRRIPSWLVPVRMSIAAVQGQQDRFPEILRDLQAAYAEDPNFHSFSVALLGISEPKASPAFNQGLAALRSTVASCGDDRTCANTTHRPHNREGFLTFVADYELKAGNVDKARELLLKVRQEPDYPRWPFKAQAEDRWDNLERYAALYANQDPADDPPHLMSSRSGAICQTCHRG